MDVKCDFISGAANTTSSSVAWLPHSPSTGDGEVVAYCVHNLIAVVDFTTFTVTETLRGHTGRINCLTCTESFLVSCDNDGTVCVWTRRGSSSWIPYKVLKGFTNQSLVALSCLDTVYGLLVATSDAAGSTFMWLCPKNQTSSLASDPIFITLDSFVMPPAQMPHALHLAVVPCPANNAAIVDSNSTHIFLFIGSVDARIHIRLALAENILNRAKQPDDGHLQTAIFHPVGALVGHEEWVTTLASVAIDDSTIMVASGSQDSKIRLWRVAMGSVGTQQGAASERITAIALTDGGEEEEEDEEDTVLDAPEYAVELAPDESLSEARLMFDVVQKSGQGSTRSVCSVFLEALLLGHEDWVTSVRWMTTSASTQGQGGSTRTHRLFSTSMDRNMIIWSPDSTSGVWSPVVRVGDIGGQLGGSVGGNLLGFVGGCLSPDARYMLAVGYGGSLHLWCSAATATDHDGAGEQWAPVPFVTGHFGPVNDLAWAPSAQYFFSVSSDQTCRLFAPLRTPLRRRAASSGSAPHLPQQGCWRELSRPQIHGYDIQSLAVAPSRGCGQRPTHLLYSGADEKLLRVFDSPSIVLDGLKILAGVDASGVGRTQGAGVGEGGEGGEVSVRVQRAYIPELGLSNRAAEMMSKEEKVEQSSRNVQGLTWTAPPLEGQLADYTVWPEVQKLYGHVNGLMCVVVSHNGRWLASACKARDADSAAVLVWDAIKYTQACALPGHDSTVVCLSFSPDDQYLATSGKDRTLCIHVAAADGAPYRAGVAMAGAHKRIVWTCGWTADGRYLATGSRDGVCKLWSVGPGPTGADGDGTVSIRCLYSFSPFAGVSVTALDFGPCVTATGPGYLWTAGSEDAPVSIGEQSQSHLLALGSEAGDIAYWELVCTGHDAAAVDGALVARVGPAHCHGATVKRISWAPDAKAVGASRSGTWKVASGGEDHCVRVFTLNSL